jgi:hypothetical protein
MRFAGAGRACRKPRLKPAALERNNCFSPKESLRAGPSATQNGVGKIKGLLTLAPVILLSKFIKFSALLWYSGLSG